MKKNRIIYVILVVGLLINNLIYPNYLSNMFFVVLLIIPIISVIHIYITYNSFRFYHSVNERILVKGDEIKYTYKIVNNTKILVYCPISVHLYNSKLYCTSEQKEVHSIILFPNESKDMIYNFECKYRGNYIVGIDKIVITDYFGLIKVKFGELETIKILVYPNINPLTYFPLKDRICDNERSIDKKLSIDKMIFDHVKDYQQGDSIKDIHWKLSAKKSTLVTKSYVNNINNKTYIFLNMKKIDIVQWKRIPYEDVLIEATVSIINYMLLNNKTTKLIYSNLKNRLLCIEGSTYKDWPMMYKNIAEANFDGQRKYIEIVEKGIEKSDDLLLNEANFVFVSYQIDDKIKNMAVEYKNKGIFVIIVTTENNQRDIMDYLVRQGVIVYELSKDSVLQTIIEGVNYVS